MKSLKNVVVACDYAFVEGGAARVAIQTAVLLAKQPGLRVFFFGGSGEPAEELKDSGVECITLGFPDLTHNPSKKDAFIHGIYDRRVYAKAAEFFRTLDPAETVLHVHTWTKVLSSAVFKAAKDCGIRIFLTIHDYFLTCPNGGCYNYVSKEICTLRPMSARCVLCNCDSRNRVFKAWRCLRQAKQNRVLKKIDIRYICISAFQREQLISRGVQAQDAAYVRNVIAMGPRERVQAENNEYYLFVGRIAQEKGADLFCKAADEAGVKAVMIGDGPLKGTLEKKYPGIRFTGWLNQEEIQGWRKQARCFVFPSVWYEGSPLTVPEMQAFGIPCIVTDCSAATDTVEDGKNGLIVRAEVQELVYAIRQMSEDDRVKDFSEATYAGFDEEGRSEAVYVRNLMSVFKE